MIAVELRPGQFEEEYLQYKMCVGNLGKFVKPITLLRSDKSSKHGVQRQNNHLSCFPVSMKEKLFFIHVVSVVKGVCEGAPPTRVEQKLISFFQVTKHLLLVEKYC